MRNRVNKASRQTDHASEKTGNVGGWLIENNHS